VHEDGEGARRVVVAHAQPAREAQRPATGIDDRRRPWTLAFERFRRLKWGDRIGSKRPRVAEEREARRLDRLQDTPSRHGELEVFAQLQSNAT
jgi:hypothetical protein